MPAGSAAVRLRMKSLTPAGVRDPLAVGAFMAEVAGMGGGYAGAQRSRRTLQEWVVSPGSANADLLPDLPLLRERSRDLERNNPLARGAIENVVTPVVGTGLIPKSQIDREVLGLSDDQAQTWERNAERLFARRAKTLDVTGIQSFEGLQELALRSVLASGDVLVLWLYGEKELQLQLVEGDRVANPRNTTVANCHGGVVVDRFGRHESYYVADRHPGETAAGAINFQPVKARASNGRRLATLLYHRRRADLARGEPYLAPVIEAFKQLGTYSKAEIDAAVISAFFTVFVKSELGLASTPLRGAPGDEGLPTVPGGTAVNGNPQTPANFKLGSGAVLDLAPGESVEFANPTRPNALFDPFVQAVLRQIGVGLGQPFEVLIKHFTASYSAAKAALIEAWRFFMVRRAWLAESFCQPVYEQVIADGIASGELAAPGFFASDLIKAAYLGAYWVGPAAGQLDPLKEANANVIAVEHGWKTEAEVTAETTGGDYERKIAQRGREAARRRQLGLDVAPVTPAPGGGPAAPAGDQQEDQQEDQPERADQA